MASVGNAKALIGTIFLQYCSYSIFYILDEIYKISPPMYRPLIKEQQVETEIPGVFKKKLDALEQKHNKKGEEPNQKT